VRPASYCQPGQDDPSLASVNACIYSHPGEGKTALWGTGSEDVLFMVSDPEGIISARALGSRPHSVQVTDYEELQECYEWLKNDRPTDFRWTVWDSLSLFQDRSLHDDIMVDAHDDNPKQDEFVPSRREYLQSMNRIGRYVRLFVDLPYNFGVSCHVMLTDDPKGEGTMFAPAVQGKGMSSKFSGYMNVVGYLGKAKTEDNKTIQRLLLQRHGRYYAKNRFAGSTGMYMDRPTLPKLDAAIADWRVKMKAMDSEGSPTPSVQRRPRRRTVKENK